MATVFCSGPSYPSGPPGAPAVAAPPRRVGAAHRLVRVPGSTGNYTQGPRPAPPAQESPKPPDRPNPGSHGSAGLSVVGRVTLVVLSFCRLRAGRLRREMPEATAHTRVGPMARPSKSPGPLVMWLQPPTPNAAPHRRSRRELFFQLIAPPHCQRPPGVWVGRPTRHWRGHPPVSPCRA